MKAVLTFDNGQKLVCDILTPPTWLHKSRPRFWDDFERDFVRKLNQSQPRAVHKVVRAHILRN